MRVHELAKELGVASKELLAALKEMGVDGLTASSSVPDQAVPRLRASGGKAVPEAKIKEAVEEPLPRPRPRKKAETPPPLEPTAAVAEAAQPEAAVAVAEPPAPPEPAGPSLPALRLVHGSTPQDVADKVGRSVAEIVKTLFTLGEMATASQSLSDEALTLLTSELGYEAEIVGVDEEEEAEEEVDESRLEPRAPVVTIMGHVDHGKTLLLDAIREAEVVAGEAGGITQHIGAYQVHQNGKLVTFLDTPGHEAFTAMRARGAKVTDLAVIVVAADDGVMPQTVEAIDHARAAGVPILIAVNKIDKPDAQPDRVRNELASQGLTPEDWGGETIFCDVSAKTKEGLDNLLEMIVLAAELEELKANPRAAASGVVIESHLDPGRGPIATVLIQRGTLHVGDALVAGANWGKVRAMLDFTGARLNEAHPGNPVEVLGLDGVCEAGERVEAVENERRVRQLAQQRGQRLKAESLARQQARKISLQEVFSKGTEGELKELNIVLKADVSGSLEALQDEIAKVPQEQIVVDVIHAAPGGITESDVMLAAASDAIIIGFNVRPLAEARRAAEREGVEIRTYSVIYKVTEDLRAAMEGMLEPEEVEEALGQAEIKELFRASRIGTIAGCLVTDGKITRTAQVRLVREGTIVWTGRIGSLRRFKDNVQEVEEGLECGVVLDGYQDVKVGDVLELFETKQVEQTLE